MSIPGGSGTPVPPRTGRPEGDLSTAQFPAVTRPATALGEAAARELIASAGDGFLAFDRDLRISAWNPRMEELTGVTPDSALGKGLLEVFPPPRQAEVAALLDRALAGETVASDDFVWSSPDAISERWLGAVFAPLRESAGGIRGVVGILRDVTARRMVAEASAPIAPQFRRLVEQAVVGMYVLQDGRYRYANPRLAATLGYTQAEILALDSIANIVALDDHALVFSRVRQTLEGSEDGSPYTFHAIHKSGRPVEVEVLEAAIELDGQPAIVGTLTDVTERRRMEAQIVAQAYNDPLTKLPNRARLLDRLDVDLAQAKRHGRNLAVVYIDIDFFKYVNDSWGHSIGDSLLQSLALRLKRSVREADTVARIGGDEFVILVPELRQSEDLASIATKLLNLVGRPFSLNGRTIQIAASIGIASYPEDGTDPESLLRNADAAMYRAKELGRNNFQLCTRELTQKAAEHLELQKGLRHALDAEEFVLHFQPITSIITGRTVGFEALVRWQHPQRGTVGPNVFIPVAEETGLILPLGDWVLRSACSELRRWHQAWLPDLRVSVNFSARQFRERNLAHLVERAIVESGLEPRHLEVEITESIAMEGAEIVVANLNVLRNMGVGIAIDDFGTGYSSMSYLKRYPVTSLKIDRSFVTDLPVNPADAGIVRAIIEMARGSSLNVIAEGVETKEQFQLLQEYGCNEMQGYWISRPQSASAINDHLKAEVELWTPR
jgi:diguanylate cyclase (GGDEF)-like protein/PAS domain S-box-containing protein